MPIGIGFEAHSSGDLIRPHASWDQAIWSRHAQEVDGIARESLDTAPHAERVAEEILDTLGSDDLVLASDSPHNDQPWLDRLLATRGAEPGRIRILSIRDALNGRVEQDNLQRMKSRLRENGPHRAAADAERAVIECQLEAEMGIVTP